MLSLSRLGSRRKRLRGLFEHFEEAWVVQEENYLPSGNASLVPGMWLYNVVYMDVGTETEPVGNWSSSTNAAHNHKLLQESDEKSAAALEEPLRKPIFSAKTLLRRASS